MRKGEQTKLRIIMKSAELFNRNGYAATTMQHIMEATGLTKGGLYRSFASKEDIAIEAFRYAGGVLWRHFDEAMKDAPTVTDKILAMCDVYADSVNSPPMEGGCPLLNTAVESDHAFPVLRDHAAGAYEGMLAFMRNMIEHGIAVGELRPDLDAAATASFIFSSVEGAIMASRLTRDNKHVRYARDHIERMLSGR